jgi:hypothetical protein
MEYPGELYQPLLRPYHGQNELSYHFHDRTITASSASAWPAQDHAQHPVRRQNVGVKKRHSAANATSHSVSD